MLSRWARVAASLILFATPASAAASDSDPCTGAEADAGPRLEQQGKFEESAAAYSAYARACTLAPDAPRALARAVELRVALDRKEDAEADTLFFRRHFAKVPSEELDRISFARARHADESGDFQAVLATLQDAHVLPEHRLEREILLLEARARAGRHIDQGEVRRVVAEWSGAHGETVAGWSAMPANERRTLSILGQMTIDVLCRGKGADLALRHPPPGTMTTQQYGVALLHWVKRRVVAIRERAACLENVAGLKPLTPPPEMAEASLLIATMFRELKPEFNEIERYKQMQAPLPNPLSLGDPCQGWLEGFICECNERMDRALEWCVRTSLQERYVGNARLGCERELNGRHQHRPPGEQFPVTEMVPPLRTPLNAVALPAPLDDPSATP